MKSTSPFYQFDVIGFYDLMTVTIMVSYHHQVGAAKLTEKRITLDAAGP
jgi:hypothetical protein